MNICMVSHRNEALQIFNSFTFKVGYVNAYCKKKRNFEKVTLQIKTLLMT